MITSIHREYKNEVILARHKLSYFLGKKDTLRLLSLGAIINRCFNQQLFEVRQNSQQELSHLIYMQKQAFISLATVQPTSFPLATVPSLHPNRMQIYPLSRAQSFSHPW